MIRSFRHRGRTVTYTLIAARNRTRLLLQALPENEIKLYVPAGYSLRDADKMVLEHLTEIDEAHARMRAAAKPISPSDTLLFRGERLKIEIIRGGVSRISPQGDILRVCTPYTDSRDIEAQIKRWLVKQALTDIRAALDEWSPTVGKPYYRVTIREQKTRWGSCSTKSNLNFNWKLIMAPPEALTYVVIHELCHLLYFNHSAQFWAEVGKRMPDYEIWVKWLKKHGKELVFAYRPE